jgi:hypothetical protein
MKLLLLDELSEKQPGRLSNLEKLLGYLRRNVKNLGTKFTNRAIYYSRLLARFLRILCIVNFKKGVLFDHGSRTKGF